MNILRLDCGVQHYTWGDPKYIPSLLGIDNPERRPHAELWMGAHPDLPARVQIGETAIPLNVLIGQAPDEILGKQVAQRFSAQLPFLMKVLSAAKPLSIQVHPSRERARAGFAKENRAGIPLTARERNYRDENHKPELIMALTEFYALRGFQPLSDIQAALKKMPELPLAEGIELDPLDLKKLYGHLMTMSQAKVDYVLDRLLGRLARESQERTFCPEDREYWTLRADREFSEGGHRDRGLFSIYLLNLIHLEPGEALFLSAGVLHSYLEGSGIEIMANSNSVLRGGLTPKHVDVTELMANVTFEDGPAEILRPVRISKEQEWAYSTPAEEFELRRIDVSSATPYRSDSNHKVEILILTESREDTRTDIQAPANTLSVKQGQVFLIPHGVAYTIRTEGNASFFKATVP